MSMNNQSGHCSFKEFVHLFELHKESSWNHPWQDPYRLSAEELETISGSIRQFQLGEGSTGNSFLARAERFSKTTGHSTYTEAVRLFIGEEQRHSEMLNAFMQINGIEPLKGHWVDWCFRRLRKLAGAETAAAVLVTAEIIACPYYRALRGATRSPLLKSICNQILAEEESHLQFQATSIGLMRAYRSAGARKARALLHRGLIEGTCAVAWKEHRSVLVAGNYTFGEFRDECLRRFELLNHRIQEVIDNYQERSQFIPFTEKVYESVTQ